MSPMGLDKGSGMASGMGASDGMMRGGGMGGMGGGMGIGGGMGGGMGMGGMMGGIGGRPTTLATLQTEDCIVVHKPKSDHVAAYSTESGTWTSYHVPKGTDVVPIASHGVVALMASGEGIGQIATYLPRVGRWFPIDLNESFDGQATPIVGPQLAVYPVGRRVYAFSVQAAAWDVLELQKGAKPIPIVWNNRATVELDDHLYVFSVKTGKWTDFNAKSGRLDVPEAK